MAGIDGFGMAKVHNVIDLPLVTEPILATLADPQPMAVADLHILLIDGQPVLDTVAEIFKTDTAVMFKCIDNGAVLPTAQFFLYPQRHVVVVQRDDGGNVMRHQFVDQRIIEGNSFRVDFSVRFGDDAGPGHGEPVAGQPAFRHKRHILLKMVVVVRRITIIGKRLFGLGVQIDDGRCASSFGHGPLYLPGRTGCAPEKTFGETGIVIVIHVACPPDGVLPSCRRMGGTRLCAHRFLTSTS